MPALEPLAAENGADGDQEANQAEYVHGLAK